MKPEKWRVYTHEHVFDSVYGYVSDEDMLAMRCSCGQWGMPINGRWHAVSEGFLYQSMKRTPSFFVVALAFIAIYLYIVLLVSL